MASCSIDGFGRDSKWLLSSNSNRWLVTSCDPVVRFAQNDFGFMETQRFVNTQITSDLGFIEFGLIS
jgi:hypothetical protein